MSAGAERSATVVVVRRAGDDPGATLDAVRASQGVAVEVRLVDTGDPAGATARTGAPLRVPGGGGEAAARNRAVALAGSETVVFLAASLRPDPQWLGDLLDALRPAPVTAAGARWVDNDGRAYPHGVAPTGLPLVGENVPVPGDVLAVSWDAMAVRRDAFLRAGGFPEDRDDVDTDIDLCWRLWLAGGRVVLGGAAPLVATSRPPARDDAVLRWRNALLRSEVHWERPSLAPVIALATAEAAATAAGAAGLSRFLDWTGRSERERDRVQAARRRSDAELYRLFTWPATAGSQRLLPLRELFELQSRFGGRHRVAVVTADTLSPTMAGPAIRAWHIAEVLAREHDVELLTTGSCTVVDAPFPVRHVRGRDLREVEQWCDVLVFQGFIMATYPWLKDSAKVMVVDIYDPFHLEQLEQSKELDEASRRVRVRNSVVVSNDQLLRGDFFTCASDKQRDFWLGQLTALGRVNPATYDEGERLDRLLAVAPFGMADRPPLAYGRPLHERVPGIGPEDRVVLWGGGIYNWFDPLTLIRAVARLVDTHPDVRLLFMGMRHPNPDVPEMQMSLQARRLADELGLAGRVVLFNEEWVPFQERVDFLLGADVGVSTHFDHVETAFSFRTRMLDYLWAGLPIVCTQGDTFGELVERHGLGRTAPAEDVDALAVALAAMLDPDAAAAARKAIAEVAPQFAWARALAPLADFCRHPRRAPDLVGDDAPGFPTPPLAPVPPPGLGLRGDLRLVRTYLRDGGLPLLLQRVRSRTRRLLSGGRRG